MNEPRWDELYSSALVRIATYGRARDRPASLIFATLELRGHEREQARTRDLESRPARTPKGARVFFRRVAMSPDAAVAWYRDLADGVCATPAPRESELRDRALDGRPLEARLRVVEPPWPELGLPILNGEIFGRDGSSNAPFIGAGSAPARLGRIVGEPDQELEAALTDETVTRFLEQRLHVNLALYPEYRGGAALVAPDPLITAVRAFVSPSPDTGDEAFVVRLTPRSGRDLSSLNITILEVRAGSLTQFVTMAVPSDGLVVVRRNGMWEHAGFVVTHPELGVLRLQAPTPFLRQISLNTALITRHVHVPAPVSDSPTATIGSYETAEYEEEATRLVGDEAHRAPLIDYYAADERRRRLATAEAHGQRWLTSPEEAQAFVRDLIGGARDRVWVADPYLGANQIFQYLHAVRRRALEIRLLTSRLAFQPEKQEDDAPSGVGERQKLARFASGLATFDERGFVDAEASVLLGRPPALHDRFLVLDKEVWFSGNSLNSLGQRASMIIRLPDPEVVIERLTGLLKEALTFSEFMASRGVETRETLP